MYTHADRRVNACALILAGIVVAPTSTRAQARFELLSRDTLARTPDVTVVTIRDRRTSNCYALPYGWLHASVPHGYVTAVPGDYYSDTTDDASTATTTSDR